jgi:hypothetical protein
MVSGSLWFCPTTPVRFFIGHRPQPTSEAVLPALVGRIADPRRKPILN